MITSDEAVHLFQVGMVLAAGWWTALFVGGVVRAIVLMMLPNQEQRDPSSSL